MTVYGPVRARVVAWHDGDTCRMDLDLGWGEYVLGSNPIDGSSNMACRLISGSGKGIDAPELKNPPAGPAALAKAAELCPPGTLVQVRSWRWDAYNRRFDGSIQLPDGGDLADAMVAAGCAVYKTFT